MSYDDYSQSFAKSCKLCNGQKQITENGKLVICICQLKAMAKHRCDQIPSDLVGKGWLDYTGSCVLGDKTVNTQNWQSARDTAFAYCFSRLPINKINTCTLTRKQIEETLKKRLKQCKILRRLEEGANLGIFGSDGTGKSLLAALVAKEIILASVFLKDNDFLWTSFSTIINAISFSRTNFDIIDEVSCVKFLVIDNVYIPQQGNYQKNVLDEIFYDRLAWKKPTIITGSYGMDQPNHFLPNNANTSARQALGEEFYKLLASHRTQKIILETIDINAEH